MYSIVVCAAVGGVPVLRRHVVLQRKLRGGREENK